MFSVLGSIFYWCPNFPRLRITKVLNIQREPTSQLIEHEWLTLLFFIWRHYYPKLEKGLFLSRPQSFFSSKTALNHLSWCYKKLLGSNFLVTDQKGSKWLGGDVNRKYLSWLKAGWCHMTPFNLFKRKNISINSVSRCCELSGVWQW